MEVDLVSREEGKAKNDMVKVVMRHERAQEVMYSPSMEIWHIYGDRIEEYL